MVSSLTGNVVQLSVAASSVTEPIAVRAQHGPDGFSTPSSRMVCLRQKSGCETFQCQLRSLSSHPGGVKHLELMTPTSKSSWAGVLNGVVIPFHDPFLML